MLMTDTRQENSYRTILGRISAFGGGQVFTILVNILRGKFVAMFLGPEGMGISSLLVSATSSVQQFAGLGVNTAAMKEIASSKDNPEALRKIMTAVTWLIWATAILGCAVCAALAPLLSRWTFGNSDYTASFAILSASVALSVGSAGYLAILQGMGEVRRFSKATLVGSLAGLLTGVPLYWAFGNAGIVPAILILSATTFLFYYISYRRACRFKTGNLKLQTYAPLLRRIISFGLVLMSGTLASTLTGYLINAIVRYLGSVEDIGLYQAANSITNQYVGVVFTALAMDYFPRLSALVRDRVQMNAMVNRQAEIVMLIMTPLILLLFLTAPLVIRILLTESFLPAIPLLKWLALGVLLQGVTFPLAYIYLAKGDKKVYFWLEIVFANVLWLAASAAMFYWMSLVGLGMSLVLRTLIEISVWIAVCRRRYGFRYQAGVARSLCCCIAVALAGFMLSFVDAYWSLVVLGVLTLAAAIFACLRIRARIRAEKADQE